MRGCAWQLAQISRAGRTSRQTPARESPPVSVEFLITTLVVVASPGTGVLYTLAAGLSRGARASIVAAFGCTLGIVPHMAAAITGLAITQQGQPACPFTPAVPSHRK